MTIFTINNPIAKSSTQIDSDSITNMNDIVDQIKEKFGIPNCINFKLFAFGAPPKFFNSDEHIPEMVKMMETRSIRDFKISYKLLEHGKQEIDMSPVKNGTVKSGFKRMIVAGGEDVMVGNTNGAHIIIPKGALGANTAVSIKEVDMVGLSIGRNVTRHVPCDMNKVNRDMNK